MMNIIDGPFQLIADNIKLRYVLTRMPHADEALYELKLDEVRSFYEHYRKIVLMNRKDAKANPSAFDVRKANKRELLRYAAIYGVDLKLHERIFQKALEKRLMRHISHHIRYALKEIYQRPEPPEHPPFTFSRCFTMPILKDENKQNVRK